MKFKSLVASLAVSVTAGLSAAPVGAATTHTTALPGNFDAVLAKARAARTQGALPARTRIAAAAALRNERPQQFSDVLGSPSFRWAPADARQPTAAVETPAQVAALARAYLTQQVPALGITAAQVAEAELYDAQRNGEGPVVARFRQRQNGVEVFKRGLNVMFDRQGRPVAVSGSFAPVAVPAAVPGFAGARSGAQAVAGALGDLGVVASAAQFLSFATRGAYQHFSSQALLPGFAFVKAPRVKPVYYPQGNALVPAHYVEIEGRKGAARPAFAFVISAADGTVLARKDLRAYEANTYRVFADATGAKQPFDAPLGNAYLPTVTVPGTPRVRTSATANLVTLDHGPIKTSDPWLAAGATTTTGNNVDAFLDSGPQLGLPLNTPVDAATGDGFLAGSGDLRAVATTARTYDYPIAADDDPSGANAQQAAIVNLFYINNWLHDFWYDRGFDEAAGNAQTVNYGRGGEEGDAISAQGQDSSGRNNANMATPADGSAPTMQMYLFDGAVRGEVRQLTPTNSGALKFSGAGFGPTTFDVTGTAVLANDGSAPATNGCNDSATIPDPTGLGLIPAIPSTPDVNAANKIIIIDRGTCSFVAKEQFAMLSGATAMVVINNGDGDPITMGDSTVPDVPIALPVSPGTAYTVPAVMIKKADGDRLKAMLAAGTPITMHVQRQAAIDFDGTFDNLVIAHEFYHYVSNRLAGGGAGLSNMQGRGMGEGWGDFSSLMLGVREEDAAVPGNERYQLPYSSGFYVVPDYYFGIRRMPYSPDFKYNSLTLKHIQDGTPLTDIEEERGQVVAPIGFGADGATNSEVHNAGEVWTNMLWSCYAGMLNTPNNGTFAEKRARMGSYVVGGLKMTPGDPTFLEARDGVLASAYATNAGDFQACARAFASRGAGIYAVAPPADSTDNVGVTESYIAFLAQYSLTGASFVPGAKNCDDDAILDAGEAGEYALTFRNDGTYLPTAPILATVSAAGASGVSFGNGGRISIPALGYGQSATVRVPVTAAATLSGSPLSVPVTVAFDALSPADPAVQPAAAITPTVIANYDGGRTRSADDMENATLSNLDWSRANTGGAGWGLAAVPAAQGTGMAWSVADPAVASDQLLTTPEFAVPAGGAFSMEFTHFFDFETDPLLGAFDGGVVEVSVNGGPWADALAAGGSFTTGAGYTGTFSAGGRNGFTGTNDAVESMVLSFPTALAGKTARLRFRLLSDETGAGTGWVVDNVKFTGAAAPAFSTITVEDAVCTVVEQVATPFGFIERTNVRLATFITSELVTLAGFTGSLPITVSEGMQYSINGGAFTNAPGSIMAGQKLAVRLVSATAENTVKQGTVTVGSFSTVFRTVTTTLDRVPDAFDFGSVSNQQPGTLVASEPRTLVNFDEASVVAGPGQSYRINGGAWTTASGLLRRGQTLEVRHTTNTASLGYTKSTLTVGGVKGTFTTRTRK